MDITPLKQILLTFMVLTPRLLAAFSILPFLNREVMPGLVRNSAALVFVLILYPMGAPLTAGNLPAYPLLVALIAKEVFLGCLMGFLAGVLFWAAEGMGIFIDNQRGAGMGGFFDPISGSQTSSLGTLLLQLITVLFFSGGGFLLLLGVIFESYRVWPVFSFFPHLTPGFSDFFLAQADRIMRLTVLLGGPIVIVMFISEIGLGLINRFAPQLNVFFISMPIKSGIAVFLLVLYVRFIEVYFEEEFLGFKHLLEELSTCIEGPA